MTEPTDEDLEDMYRLWCEEETKRALEKAEAARDLGPNAQAMIAALSFLDREGMDKLDQPKVAKGVG